MLPVFSEVNRHLRLTATDRRLGFVCLEYAHMISSYFLQSNYGSFLLLVVPSVFIRAAFGVVVCVVASGRLLARLRRGCVNGRFCRGCVNGGRG